MAVTSFCVQMECTVRTKTQIRYDCDKLVLFLYNVICNFVFTDNIICFYINIAKYYENAFV